MNHQRSNILIVDDSALITKRLIEMLNNLPCIDKVFCASNVAGALIILEQQPIKTVLLDINLPGLNGIELLRLIVKNYSSQVIMVTNSATEYYRSLCKKIGAGHFIDKSKDFEMIPTLVGHQQVCF